MNWPDPGHQTAAATPWEILNSAGIDPAPRRTASSITAADFFHPDNALGKHVHLLWSPNLAAGVDYPHDCVTERVRPMLRIQQRRRNRPDTPAYRSIIVIDIAGSGRWDNQAQLRGRAVPHDGLRTALRMAGVDRSGIDIADRVDGMILVIPPEVAKVDLSDPMIPFPAKAIHDHNKLVDPRFRIRLRVAIRAGELHNGHPWLGRYRLEHSLPSGQRNAWPARTRVGAITGSMANSPDLA